MVWKLDRLTRSTRSCFLSLSEPWADTTSHAGRMILTVFSTIYRIEAIHTEKTYS
jgi:DNA invertase Pin-like site-specific DNA recombinase